MNWLKSLNSSGLANSAPTIRPRRLSTGEIAAIVVAPVVAITLLAGANTALLQTS